MFLLVAKESEFVYDELSPLNSVNENPDDDDADLPVDSDQYTAIDLPPSHSLRKEPTSYPMRALFRKNFVLQRRQTCSNVCQILTPIIVVALLLILQTIIKQELGENYNKVNSNFTSC